MENSQKVFYKIKIVLSKLLPKNPHQVNTIYSTEMQFKYS